MLDRLMQTALTFRSDKAAVTAMEYALIAALIAVVIIGALMTIGSNIGTTFGLVSSEL